MSQLPYEIEIWPIVPEDRIFKVSFKFVWACTWENVQVGISEQYRFRSSCPSSQCYQNLHKLTESSTKLVWVICLQCRSWFWSFLNKSYSSTINNSSADNFKNIQTNIWKRSINEIISLNRVENIWKKEEIAHYEQIYFFKMSLLQMRQKISASGKGLSQFRWSSMPNEIFWPILSEVKKFQCSSYKKSARDHILISNFN